MPDLSGIQLYETLTYKPLLIFSTAYSNYAVSGFDLNAVDYLVKPFSFERFLKAANKALKSYTQNNQAQAGISGNTREFMFVKDGTKIVKVVFQDIYYLEGMKDYVKIVMKDNYFLTLISMQKILDYLPSDSFIRIHRSFIVSIPQIDKVEKNRVVVAGKWLPVSSSYKEQFSKALDRIN